MTKYVAKIIGAITQEGSSRKEAHSESYEVDAPNENIARRKAEDYIKNLLRVPI